MVSKMLTLENDVLDPEIRFNFELYAENPTIFNPEEKCKCWKLGFFGWELLFNLLPNQLDDFSDYIEIENNWTWDAPCRIEVDSTVPLVNPKILNIVIGDFGVSTFYKLETQTTELVFDNTNPNNEPNLQLVVTDAGVDIRDKRTAWTSIFLKPGKNYIIVIADNYEDALDGTKVCVKWRDTYIL